MEHHIIIEHKGKVKISESITVVDPKVTCIGSKDDMINSVSISVKFESDTYSYGRNIGSFEYSETWENEDVENYIKEYLNENTISN